MKGCLIAGGDLIVDDYGKPLVWIGCYTALASFICSAAMAVDAYFAVRNHKPWRTCRFFSLNAATLALLTIAVKLPVDLNTAMPRSTDQLAKLSGTVFLCTAMGNFLPSLGDSSAIFANVIALAILVITVVVNIRIQKNTGVIYVFVNEHLAVTHLLVFLLIFSISSALAIAVAKEKLDKEFDRKIRDPKFSPAQPISLDNLKSCAEKFLLMVQSSSPQYVLSGSMISATAMFFCLAAAGILIEALLRGLIWKTSLKLCHGTSDYAWSTIGVLILQSMGVIIGTISPACRWFSEAKFYGSRKDIDVENHWLLLLFRWKRIPLEDENITNFNAIFSCFKIFMIEIGIVGQAVVVSTMKVVQFLSLFLLSSTIDNGGIEDSHLKDYVLRLEKHNFVPLIRQGGRREFERWIQAGRDKKALATKNLIERYSTKEQGFTQVCTFLPRGENCWALPLVTLTAIAATISTSEEGTQSLLRAVGEGLRYVRLVDKHLDNRGMVNHRKAADMVWKEVHMHNKWLGAMLAGVTSTELALKNLVRIAKNRARNTTRDLEFSKTALAAVCMRDIARLLLNERPQTMLFERLQVAIADILGACLTNLPMALFSALVFSEKQEREKSARYASSILGEVEELFTLVHIPEVAKPHIREWSAPQSS